MIDPVRTNRYKNTTKHLRKKFFTWMFWEREYSVNQRCHRNIFMLITRLL
jgi:hypothetical protein